MAVHLKPCLAPPRCIQLIGWDPQAVIAGANKQTFYGHSLGLTRMMAGDDHSLINHRACFGLQANQDDIQSEEDGGSDVGFQGSAFGSGCPEAVSNIDSGIPPAWQSSHQGVHHTVVADRLMDRC